MSAEVENKVHKVQELADKDRRLKQQVNRARGSGGGVPVSGRVRGSGSRLLGGGWETDATYNGIPSGADTVGGLLFRSLVAVRKCICMQAPLA